jgi:glucose/arabinose dehydrogenase
LFVSLDMLHGSWNRTVASGYRVVFVPIVNGMPGPLEDFLTGFAAFREPGRSASERVLREQV